MKWIAACPFVGVALLILAMILTDHFYFKPKREVMLRQVFYIGCVMAANDDARCREAAKDYTP